MEVSSWKTVGAVMTSFLQEFDAQRAVLSEFIVSFLSLSSTYPILRDSRALGCSEPGELMDGRREPPALVKDAPHGTANPNR